MRSVPTNVLSVNFDYDKIDRDYLILLVQTSEKWIDGGSRIFDRQDDFPVMSVVFDRGRSAWLLVDRRKAFDRAKFLASLGDDTLSLRECPSSYVQSYILVRFFMFALDSSQMGEEYSNIGGGLYIYDPSFPGNAPNKKKKAITALRIDVTHDLEMKATASKFSCLQYLAKGKLEAASEHLFPKYPRYKLVNCRLIRARDYRADDLLFIQKSSGDKARVDFLSLTGDRSKTKSYRLFEIVRDLSSTFGDYLTVSLRTAELKNEHDFKRRDDQFFDRAVEALRREEIVLVDWCGGHEEEIDELKSQLEKALGHEVRKVEEIPDDRSVIKLVCIHNKSYYDDPEFSGSDPYVALGKHRDGVVQAITYEDAIQSIVKDTKRHDGEDKHISAIIKTIIKEAAIKLDIRNGRFSLKAWDYEGEKWVFGKAFFDPNSKVKERKYLFMSIFPDGSFSFETVADGDFGQSEETRRLSDLFEDETTKDDWLVMNGKRDIVLISKTNRFALPNEEHYMSDEEIASRSKKTIKENLSGIVEVNLFEGEDDDSVYYSAGEWGYGMRDTLISNASIFYKCQLIEGESNFVWDMLSMLSVAFVRNSGATVVPYPFKYLSEWRLQRLGF